MVDVLQEQIDGRQSLRESAFERVPLAAGDDPREQVEWEDPLRALIVSIHGEGDALREERAVGFELTLPQLILRGDEQFLDQRAIVWPRAPIGLEHLVVRIVETVLREERATGRPGARRMKRRHELEG